MLSRTQAGPGRTVKQEQEEISRNHVQTFIFPSVCRGWRASGIAACCTCFFVPSLVRLSQFVACWHRVCLPMHSAVVKCLPPHQTTERYWNNCSSEQHHLAPVTYSLRLLYVFLASLHFECKQNASFATRKRSSDHPSSLSLFLFLSSLLHRE